MKIPEKVRIAGDDFQIICKSGPIVVDTVQCCGSIEYERSIIRIDTDICGDTRAKQTLLHEILHGIARDRDIDFGDASEEDIVEAFARGIYQVIADNPDMFQKEVG